MHNLVATVFKTLGIFIILVFIMGVTIVIIDNNTSRDRAERVHSYALEVLMDNNAIPSTMKDVIEKDLQEIVSNSNIIKSFEWNYDKSIEYNGVTYPPVGERYAKGYGERAELVILLHKETSINVFGLYASNGGTSMGVISMKSTDAYIDSVPTLRYLK